MAGTSTPTVRVVPGALTMARAFLHLHPDWTVEDAVHATKAAFGEDPVTELVVEAPKAAGPFVLSAGDVVRVLSWARFANEQGGPMATNQDAGSLALALALEEHLHPEVFVVADSNEPM